MKNVNGNTSKTKSLVTKVAIAILLIAFPLLANSVFDWNYSVLIACFICLYTIAISGLDIVFGYSGQISMGHAAFYCIGAYGSAMLHEYLHLAVFLSMFCGAAIATVVGAVIAYPASKLVFHFLALATIALGEIVFQLVSQSPGKITGDFTGMFTQTVTLLNHKLEPFKLNTYTKYYYFALICLVIFLIIKTNLVKSKVGRAFIAIRENSHAADGMGIDVRKYKVIAFAVSAFFTAYAGAMYVHLVRFISPDTFTNKQSVLFLTMLLFGGTGSLGGPICGAVSVLLLTEFLRFAEKYQMLIYGVLLLIVIIAMPGGVYGVIEKIKAKIAKMKRGNSYVDR